MSGKRTKKLRRQTYLAWRELDPKGEVPFKKGISESLYVGAMRVFREVKKDYVRQM